MYTCVILHNMIIEDERDMEDDFNYDCTAPPPEIWRENMTESELELEFHVESQMAYRNAHIHRRLQQDFTNYLWNFVGSQ